MPSDVDEAEFELSVTAPKGTSLAAMDEAMRAIEDDVLDTPRRATVLSQVGGGFLGQVNSARSTSRIAPHEERSLLDRAVLSRA